MPSIIRGQKISRKKLLNSKELWAQMTEEERIYRTFYAETDLTGFISGGNKL